MLSYLFDRFYVVTIFILPTINDLKVLPVDCDSECSYLNVDLKKYSYPMSYLPNIRNFCKKIVPFTDFYKKQIDYFNKTVHDILTRDSFDISKEQKRKDRYNYFISNRIYQVGL